MPVTIEVYTADRIEAVREFNRRLIENGINRKFPESNVAEWLPKIEGRKIYQELYLALEDRVVRGGYILKHQEFYCQGKTISIGDFQLPLSEGIINKSYNFVGVQMFFDALKRQNVQYVLGMGGYDQPLTKIVLAVGWKLHLIPFYFRVVHASQLLRNITFLRRRRLFCILLDFLRWTGIGWFGITVWQRIMIKKMINNKCISVEIVNEFSEWADNIWKNCKEKYTMIAVRDSTTLNILYPTDTNRFICLRIKENSYIIGWAVVLDTKMENHKQFGNMRLGSIIDCLALPENAFKIIKAATSFLENRKVDVIVSNLSHKSWYLALQRSGFLRGKSNFIFASSKKLTEILEPFEINKYHVHLTRGDGDGPINL